MFDPVKNYNYISLTIINYEINEVFKLLRKRLIDEYENVGDWSFFSNPNNIPEIMGSGQTMSGKINRKFLIWEPDNYSNKTIFLSNSTDGCYTVINASLPESIDMIRISVSKYNIGNFNSFEYRKDSKTRLIMAYYNEPWEFYQEGDIQSFENKKYYKRKLIKDRLNYEIINEYLEANGWDLNNPDFWSSKKNAIYFIEKNKNKKDQ